MDVLSYLRTLLGYIGVRLRTPDELARVRGSEWGQMALECALSEIGAGEEGANNDGHNIQRYRGAVDPKRTDTHGAWCAAFVSYCLRQGAEGEPIGFPLSFGAKRLFKRLKKYGSLVEPEDALPGDVICWHRGKAGSWKGHIGLIEFTTENGLISTVEGNVGRYPAKVRRFTHDISYERLYGIVRPRRR